MTTSTCECCGVYFDSPSTRFYCSEPCQTWMQRRYSGHGVETRAPAKTKPVTMSVNAAQLEWIKESAAVPAAGTLAEYHEQRTDDAVNDLLITRHLTKPRKDLTGFEGRKI